MANKIKLTVGQSFPDTRLTLIREVAPHIKPSGLPVRMIECKCDCGNTTTIRLHSVRSANTISCGCAQTDATSTRSRLKKRNTPSRSKLYGTHTNMKQRCDNPKTPNFAFYGALGIGYDDTWKDYAIFSQWANANGYKEGLTLERHDSSLDYSPSNCYWSTWKKQNRNKTDCYWWVVNNIAYESCAQAITQTKKSVYFIDKLCVKNPSKSCFRLAKYDTNKQPNHLPNSISVYTGI